jgi:hypothetical protein
MSGTNISRRKFTAAASLGLVATCAPPSFATQDESASSTDNNGPREADFERDYDAPSFKPSWKKEQVNRTMAQDFVIYAHSDLPMVKKLLTREPGLLNATLDWGGGDWETALGGASHMGRRDIVEYLLEQGGRPDIFCFTMLGMLEPVQSMLELQPALIDAKGPHGFNLHFHAQVGQENSKEVLDYLQSVKEIKLRPVPFLRKKKK